MIMGYCMKREQNELMRFVIGVILVACGLYWFMTNVTVTTGFYAFTIGNFKSGGLVVVPLIIGIVWMCINNESIVARWIAAIGVLLIVASIIMGTRFTLQRLNLYEYIIMLIFIFAGLGLILSVVLAKPKSRRGRRIEEESYNKLQDELEEELEKIKKKYR